VRSLAVLLEVLESPAVETVAVLVTLGTAAAPTPTVSVIALLAFAAIGPALLHVTACPDAVQPQPDPDAETKLKPVGRVSITVIEAVVAAVPTLLTDRVYVALFPTTKSPL